MIQQCINNLSGLSYSTSRIFFFFPLSFSHAANHKAQSLGSTFSQKISPDGPHWRRQSSLHATNSSRKKHL